MNWVKEIETEERAETNNAVYRIWSAFEGVYGSVSEKTEKRGVFILRHKAKYSSFYQAKNDLEAIAKQKD